MRNAAELPAPPGGLRLPALSAGQLSDLRGNWLWGGPAVRGRHRRGGQLLRVHTRVRSRRGSDPPTVAARDACRTLFQAAARSGGPDLGPHARARLAYLSFGLEKLRDIREY